MPPRLAPALALGLAVATLSGCDALPRVTPVTDAASRDTREVDAVSREFIALFNACRMDELSALFQPHARFLSAGSPLPIAGRAGIRQYFARPCGMAPPAKATVSELVTAREGPLAYATGSFVLAQPQPTLDAGHPFSAQMHFTIVLRREGARWQIAAYHVSQGA